MDGLATQIGSGEQDIHLAAAETQYHARFQAGGQQRRVFHRMRQFHQ